MSPSTRVVAGLGVLLSIGLLSIAEPVGPASAATFSRLQEVDVESVDAYIRASMHAARIPGLALAVVRGDRIAYLKGYGIAGPDGRPVTPQTPFILGSTSKSFTALAVMQLVEAGKIDLDAPVTRYLPWFRTRDLAGSAQISVRHLLHQTSGLQTDEGRQGFWDSDQSSAALEKGIRELSHARLRQPAGQRFEYANENYNTLGLIVQAVSGMPYEQYVRSAIFAPLQMGHSAAALSDAAAADLASGYRYWLLWPVAFDGPYPRRMTPAGFLISSAEDMAHYVAAQLNGGTYEERQLLSPQGIATLHTPGAKMGPADSYGMGWAIHSVPGSTTIWHDGDVNNFHSHLLLVPDQHLGMVLLMNVGESIHREAITSLVDGVAARLLGRGQAAPTSSLRGVLTRLTVMAPLLVAILWAGWSYRSLRRWQHRGEPIPHGFSRFWRLYVPLAVDLCSVAVTWILMPATVHAPMAAIALFAPDAFAVVVAITGLAVGCAAARTVVALRPRRHLAPPQPSRSMEAIVQYQYGSPDVLALRNIDRPAIGNDGVLVRVVSASLHIGDWHVMTGLPYMLRLVGFGLRAPRVRVRGIDVAGKVEAVGPQVTQFHVGDDVFGTCDGSFAEYASARQDMLVHKPANLSFDQAAAVPTSSFAALQALRDRGEIRPGQRVLIVGASGGVGMFAVQIAKALGAQVTGVCSAAKVGVVRALGADHVIDHASEDFSRSGQRYDLVLDVGGGRSLSALRRALTRHGTLVLVGGEGGGRVLGGTSKWIQALLVSPFVSQKLRLLSTTPRRTDLAFVTELIESGKMAPVIDRTFALKDVPEAFRYLERGRTLGKVVIKVKQSG